jgi:hypothetical protein
MWWLERWASDGAAPRHEELIGRVGDLLGFLDRWEADVLPVVAISIVGLSKPVHEHDLGIRDATLLADGELAVLTTNDGVVRVGVEPGSESRRGHVELRDPRGPIRHESADVIILRDFAFSGLKAWLHGRETAVAGIEWDLYRKRGQS